MYSGGSDHGLYIVEECPAVLRRGVRRGNVENWHAETRAVWAGVTTWNVERAGTCESF